MGGLYAPKKDNQNSKKLGGIEMFGYIGWGLFVLTLLISVVQHKRHINFRMSLSAYVKWMLLDDTTRDNHKGKFKDFLKTTEFGDYKDLFLATDRAIEEMATTLKDEGSSLLVVTKLMREEMKN